MLISVDLCEC